MHFQRAARCLRAGLLDLLTSHTSARAREGPRPGFQPTHDERMLVSEARCPEVSREGVPRRCPEEVSRGGVPRRCPEVSRGVPRCPKEASRGSADSKKHTRDLKERGTRPRKGPDGRFLGHTLPSRNFAPSRDNPTVWPDSLCPPLHIYLQRVRFVRRGHRLRSVFAHLCKSLHRGRSPRRALSH